MSSWTKTTFAALGHRDFRLLWLGGLASFVAFFMAMIVQSVVAFEISGSNEAVGQVVAGQGFAMAALGPIGGAFADRWPKRRVIAVAQGITIVTFTALAYLVATGLITLPLLVIAAVLIGACLAFLAPARQGLVVDIAPLEMRGNAMAITNVANTGARVVGPAIAGMLLAWDVSGAVGAYLCMAFFYGVSAGSLLLLPKSVVRPGARERPIFADIAAGMRYVAGQRKLLILVVLFVTVILSGFPHVTVLPGLVENVLGRDAADMSLLLVASAVGALSASLLVARFGDSPGAHRVFIALGVVFGLALLCASVAPSLGLVAAAMFWVGAGSGGFQALNASVVARYTEPAFIGRVMSLVILAFAGFGLMSLPYGMLADWMGERQTLATMGVVVLVLCSTLGTLLAREDWSKGPTHTT